MYKKYFLVELVAVLLLFSFTRSEAQDANKGQILDEFLKHENFVDNHVNGIITTAAGNVILQDGRAPVERNKIVEGLESKVDKVKLTENYRAMWDKEFSAQELDYLLKFRQSEFGKKYRALLKIFRKNINDNVLESVEKLYPGGKIIPVAKPKAELTAEKSKEASAIVKFIWRMFPETKTCQSVVQ